MSDRKDNAGRRPLVIMGAGGFGREAYCWIDRSRYQVTGFFDEVPKPGLSLFDLPVSQELKTFPGHDFLVAVGSPRAKARLTQMALEAGLTPAGPMAHPTAVIGIDVVLGPGTLICPQSIITTHVRCGGGFIMNLGATLGHDCEVGEYVTISPGACVSGGVTIGDLAYIGTGASIREGVRVGRGSTVGMGAVVVKDVAPDTTVVGNPARHLQK